MLPGTTGEGGRRGPRQFGFHGSRGGSAAQPHKLGMVPFEVPFGVRRQTWLWWLAPLVAVGQGDGDAVLLQEGEHALPALRVGDVEHLGGEVLSCDSIKGAVIEHPYTAFRQPKERQGVLRRLGAFMRGLFVAQIANAEAVLQAL